MYTVTLNLTLVLLASLSFFPSLELFFFFSITVNAPGVGVLLIINVLYGEAPTESGTFSGFR